MKDTLPKGRRFTATKEEVGKGKLKAGGKRTQASINKAIMTDNTKKKVK